MLESMRIQPQGAQEAWQSRETLRGMRAGVLESCSSLFAAVESAHSGGHAFGAGGGEHMFTRVSIRKLGARTSAVSKVLARGEGGSRWVLGGSV